MRVLEILLKTTSEGTGYANKWYKSSRIIQIID